eukprot:SAG31_NODE_337_length_17493_cov_5.855755_14_plen_240_part_00
MCIPQCHWCCPLQAIEAKRIAAAKLEEARIQTQHAAAQAHAAATTAAQLAQAKAQQAMSHAGQSFGQEAPGTRRSQQPHGSQEMEPSTETDAVGFDFSAFAPAPSSSMDLLNMGTLSAGPPSETFQLGGDAKSGTGAVGFDFNAFAPVPSPTAGLAAAGAESAGSSLSDSFGLGVLSTQAGVQTGVGDAVSQPPEVNLLGDGFAETPSSQPNTQVLGANLLGANITPKPDPTPMMDFLS